MNIIGSVAVMVVMTSFSSSLLAKVYKCPDEYGNTTYQAIACVDNSEAVEINVKTGGETDLATEHHKKMAEKKLTKSLALKQQKMADLMDNIKKSAARESAANQKIIKNNPVQYSAFAIPPYDSENLSILVKMYEERLPDIERLRRLAAQRALETGECIRVEAANLSDKSDPDQLGFSVDCSSTKSFFYEEAQLLPAE